MQALVDNEKLVGTSGRGAQGARHNTKRDTPQPAKRQRSHHRVLTFGRVFDLT
jgi:hypothetical protein